MKKGRHRRFEEARSLKRSASLEHRKCPECGAEGDDDHAAWCLAEEGAWDELLGDVSSNGMASESGQDGQDGQHSSSEEYPLPEES
ncbi:MAG: hypothetical protein ACYDGY_03515 [Acidimicrobiales bacterium]